MEIHVEVAPQALWHIGPVPITNTMVMMFLVMGILLIGGWLLARSLKLVPGKVQSVFELIVEFMLGLVEGTAGTVLGREIFPLIGGLFLFLIFSNYIELLPGLGTVGLVHHVSGTRELIPLVRPPTSDLNMT